MPKDALKMLQRCFKDALKMPLYFIVYLHFIEELLKNEN